MSKILYAASTIGHINNFHLPYIEKLRLDGNEVFTMARGEGADFDIPFVKKMLSPKNFFVRRRIKRILKSEKFDTVILNTTLAAFHIRLAMQKKERPKVINIVHGYLFSEHSSKLKYKLMLFCEKILRKKTDSIVVMNSADFEIATSNSLCISDVKMTYGMGAKVSKQSTPCEKIRQYIGAEQKFLMCFVGELSARKNQRFLICALPEIKISIPDAELILVGSGALERELKELSEKLGVSSYVHFVGQKPNPCDFIYACDLYVSASEIEGMPFNIIEALGCKKTVLCSNIKGHTDLIENEKSGYLYSFADISKFVEMVKEIHSGKLSLSSDAIIEKYKEYSFDQVFSNTYETIKELIL